MGIVIRAILNVILVIAVLNAIYNRSVKNILISLFALIFLLIVINYEQGLVIYTILLASLSFSFKMIAILVAIFGFIMMINGIRVFIKTKSRKSLIVGIIGALLMLSFILLIW